MVSVDSKDVSAPPFFSSQLKVKGQALRCKPDVVLQNTTTGDIIIIERKATRVPIEKIQPMGWANLKAQLWCYSHINQWHDAPNVYLIGQFWSVTTSIEYRKEMVTLEEVFGGTYESEEEISFFQNKFHLLPIFPRRSRNDMEFQAEGRALFEQYGGNIVD